MNTALALLWLLSAVQADAPGPDSRSGILDGTAWKITFPAASSKGNALEITNPELSKILEGKKALPGELMKYLQLADDEVAFVTPYTGITTSSGTKYSRTELREMRGTEEHNWTLETGGLLRCRLKVSDLKGEAKKIIVMQVHGKAPESKPLLKCLWEKGFIRLLTKSGPKLKDFSRKSRYTNVGLDQWFTCTIRATRDALTIQVNGEIVETFGPDVLGSWPKGNTYYFKAGNYLQHDTKGAEATVRFSSIRISH